MNSTLKKGNSWLKNVYDKKLQKKIDRDRNSKLQQILPKESKRSGSLRRGALNRSLNRS